jgi:hypothetical protein
MSAIDDLKKVRAILIEQRRQEAVKLIAGGTGELARWAPAILNTTNWIAAVDHAVDDEQKLVSSDRGGVATRSFRSRRQLA